MKKFIMPGLSRRYLTRVGIVALTAWMVFSYLLIPIRINGMSMEPAYHDGGFNFIFSPYGIISEYKRHDVVGVRLAGKSVMLLKRIVALEGETVEFRKGKLYVDGEAVKEDYIKFPCDWELAPRKVEKGKVYVVGDNRDMDMKNHVFGQSDLERIVGVPLW